MSTAKCKSFVPEDIEADCLEIVKLKCKPVQFQYKITSIKITSDYGIQHLEGEPFTGKLFVKREKHMCFRKFYREGNMRKIILTLFGFACCYNTNYKFRLRYSALYLALYKKRQ